MKVRHNNRLYEVVGNWSHFSGKKFYVVEAAIGFECKPCDESEEVKADHWQDVTGECRDNGFNYIFHPGCNNESGGIHGYEARKHYRLRKVQVGSIITGDREVLAGHEQVRMASTDRMWAFIVERKVD